MTYFPPFKHFTMYQDSETTASTRPRYFKYKESNLYLKRGKASVRICNYTNESLEISIARTGIHFDSRDGYEEITKSEFLKRYKALTKDALKLWNL